MDENKELLKYIYENASMGYQSTSKLLKELREKDNKITKSIDVIKNGYKKFKNESKKQIKGSKIDLITKITSGIGIKSSIKKDNSDSAIAKLLIEGLTMGTTDIEVKLNRYKKNADKKIVILASDYLAFQNDSIEHLKNYL